MTDQAIEIGRLVVHIHQETLLEIERLSLRRGEFLGLIGPNGAGKTTLLRSCLGMQRHAHGDVSILGQSVRKLGFLKKAQLRRKIGYLPQLLPVRGEMPLTVREAVAIGRTGIAGLLKRLSAQDWLLIDEWLERLGLSSLARQGYGEISGGEQRKTLIARAMVQQPEILLLDEPTANLDLGWRERLVQVVEQLHESMRITIVLVCHELEALPRCCQRVAVLQNGRLIADGLPEQTLNDRLLESLYGPGLSVFPTNHRYAVVPGAVAHA